MRVTPDLDPSLRMVARPPTVDDVPAITALMNAADLHDYGAAEMSDEEVRDDLGRVDLETDAWLVHDAGRREGDPIAFADLARRGGGAVWEGYVVVLPQRRRRGIGTALARALEARARERVGEAPAGVRVMFQGWIKGSSEQDRAWARALGMEGQRTFLRMRIDLAERPPAPEWPEGIQPRPFVLGQDEVATHDAITEAFADHWGHLDVPFDEWVTRTRSHSFDAGLWLLAMEGDEIVATSLGSAGPEGGWIGGLGTRRAWRGRGVAAAILREHFRVFWDRGVRTVQLGVDADSLTGATRLYEKAGMRVTERHEQVAMVLREGRDIAVRSLDG